MTTYQPLSARALADQRPTPEDVPVIITVGLDGYDILANNFKNKFTNFV
jgi:hypothetical protein